MIFRWQLISSLKALIAQTATRYALLAASNKEILNKAIGVAEVFVAAAAMLDVTITTLEDATMVGMAGVVVEEAEVAPPVPLMGDDQSLLILTFHPLNGVL
jgi:hypothetical protein